MKSLIIIAVSAITFASCNNSDNKSADNKSTQPTSAEVDKKMAEVTEKQQANTATPATTVSIKEILDGYLKIKNAFAKDNDKDAAMAGNEMVKAFAGFNKAALTTDEAKIYNDIEDDAREHAEHIGSNAGNIKHQREHFDMLSKDIYQLVKTFGGGQKLYYDHCPMYNDGKGANWVSETKEIANPYLGKSMPTCGTVKEELK
ncbi:MAG: DUF3347 domain-containing protein [Ferruginibacter sp.]|jgi:hypothetical protein